MILINLIYPNGDVRDNNSPSYKEGEMEIVFIEFIQRNADKVYYFLIFFIVWMAVVAIVETIHKKRRKK
ncbi:hypothetical protein D7Z26_18565 [Cohnella endophytica]|uniref:Uncharacterized protein n=1 Tax=Cohnella endophytica TaxID=2419778 RepID=A0A494XGG2_9BACL|nr:hypothetical protein D7Z26_18565 [Cohnella endophytica]